ncbi:YbaB/EbfC family nucleoid-associated protein [Umezawaea sp. Da 62-37]|uniref:YbaB/EbfC family nucleoid-associated protein n=1 Tax=Umezawaea sp. Da 62-37 TaxID=3075927 RepID=UPI0028F730AF|nr:YbaB/EbfC family nucleoid-associated protein [Umezawaea sp. Da 62-37]WNV82144.1 YbaB/EbfC family nucleoid-associated protein [Umezawaea sp. Da 62-37]
MDPLGPIDANRMKNVDPEQWLADMHVRMADLQQKSAELTENLAASSATVSSKDGAVTVTIAPTGALQHLELTPRAAGMSPGRLTASIMEAVHKGQRASSEKMVEAFAPLGEGTESMNLVLSFIPADEDDEGEDIDERDLRAVDDLDDGSQARRQEPQQAAQPPVQQPYVPQAPQQAAPPPPPPQPARAQPDFEEHENHPW